MHLHHCSKVEDFKAPILGLCRVLLARLILVVVVVSLFMREKRVCGCADPEGTLCLLLIGTSWSTLPTLQYLGDKSFTRRRCGRATVMSNSVAL